MALTPQQLIILDRDGVINEDSDQYIKSLKEWKPYPQAIDSIARLSNAGWAIAIATNQSGIARGYLTEDTLAQIHHAMLELVQRAGGNIAHIAYCPHGPNDACDCRKPRAGLLRQIRHALGLKNLDGAWLVGDSMRDLQAGAAMGCRRVLVRTGKGANTELNERLNNILVFNDLSEFTEYLLQH
ncbi:D-glycero-beta-D-manno-heptose 1,7-bisphosphate 7-phosphatase [Halomonas sp. GXIMD04776]|uniref:D-glycero-beta-D-manno-heptose 1,7-bisphosphate 7-phosphatase n=1 Tax=Halomonas sp. GXIMD04776 TaxID=3415605 RepID=UPI003CA15125